MTELVQPIVLLRSGSHEDAVRCVAEASLRAYVSAPDLPDWEAWLAGSSTKTVRRPAVVWVAGDPTHVEDEEELGVAYLLGDACHQLLECHRGEAPVGVGVRPGALHAESAGGTCQLLLLGARRAQHPPRGGVLAMALAGALHHAHHPSVVGIRRPRRAVAR